MGERPLIRAVFLDRDGVLNEPILRNGRPFPPSSVRELRISNGAREALELFDQFGLKRIVVTNQPDIARGHVARSVVETIHIELCAALPIDYIYVCEHDDVDACQCRKPRPGMMTAAAAEHGINLSGSYLIGDRWRDIAAGQAAGLTTVFLNRQYSERLPEPPADYEVTDISEAASWIAAIERRKTTPD